MTDTPMPFLPDDDDALAAEYVLRLLDPEAHRAAARRIGEDPGFAARVFEWEARLAEMAKDLDPVPPRARTRVQLMQEIAPPQARPRRWWLGAGFGLATVAALLLIAPIPMLRAPSFGAEIASADGSLRFTAEVSRGREELVLARVAGGPRPGRALELWLIADGAPAPVSLGVLPENDRIKISLTPQLATQLDGGTLALSDEPPGGSPTGAPTGDVLAAAPLVAL
ncbi:anti-sigma factor [Antarctobacter jejuensis]|uniref:anti-sigma factor n=1 Tax=Antarctobacter jejuensis TaxID=1439938 RepID=UPI003FD15B43